MNENRIQIVKITRVINECEGVRTIFFKVENPLIPKPGQFVMIWVPGVDEIPMSIAGCDEMGNWSITVKEIGECTKALNELKEGDYIGVRGPLGKHFEIPQETHKHVFLVGGGIGMVAIGAGGLDVAVAMAGGPFYMTYPKITKINLTGKLKPWVSAKDLILRVLEIFTTKGNVGTIFEYSGPGVKTLSVPERATITNMGAECGVTTSVFPSDEITKEFLKAQEREKDWIEVQADEDAIYDKTIEINLSEIEPLASTPHSPGNIQKVKELEGMEVDQVCLGSCTNSSYRDLMRVAKILYGKVTHTNVHF